MLLANTTTKTSAVIEPDRCCVEDWEVLAFGSEEELHLYTIWHDDLRKSCTDEANGTGHPAEPSSTPASRSHLRSLSSANRSRSKRRPLATATLAAATLDNQQTPTKLFSNNNNNDPLLQQQPTTPLTKYQQRQLRKRQLQQQRQQLQQQANHPATLLNQQQQNVLQMRSSTGGSLGSSNTSSGLATSANLERVLPPGFIVVNSSSEPSSKYAIRYKSTKLYNKYRGQQIRTAAFLKKQREQQILTGLTSGFLNTWLAYSALQALRLPNDFWTPQYSYLMQTPMQLPPQAAATTAHLSTQHTNKTAAARTNGFKSPEPRTNLNNNACDPHHQPAPLATLTTTTPGVAHFGLISAPQPIGTMPTQAPVMAAPAPQAQPQQPFVPYHLIVVGPGKVIPYSNRIYPQQVAEYKRKSHLLPSTASSKKSSAASYDVNEIMEVLANTTKTNVTITRNAIKSSAASTTNGLSNSSSKQQQTNSHHTGQQQADGSRSVYSHTVNANAQGIVSTQLHLQARSYLDSMSKFYAEEWQLLEQRNRELMQEPSIEEQVGKYLNLGPSPTSTTASAPSATSSVKC